MRTLTLLLFSGQLAFLSSDAEKPVSDYNQPGTSLFVQSAGQVLSREYGNCHGSSAAPASEGCSQSDRTSFLALDAHTGAVIASRWENPEKPIPLGALVKPFTAPAYGDANSPIRPMFVAELPLAAGFHVVTAKSISHRRSLTPATRIFECSRPI